jgi:hypothetical protein
MKAHTSARSPKTDETEDGFFEEGLPGELSREKNMADVWNMRASSSSFMKNSLLARMEIMNR